MIKTKKFKSLLACLLCLTITASNFNTAFANISNTLYSKESQFEEAFDRILGVVPADEIQYGFKKVKSEYVSDYGTEAVTYEHIKTGAKVLVINNGDEEKFFTIGFKTQPTNNTGVNHVFEHTTLQGSKNYPVKSMLTTLGSTSMATFFNAATSDDFTFYPFGSLNEKDYYNLMNIYLDGIFYPMVMTDRNVFKRDGVRLDLLDGALRYNGVVYNEMKNAGSNTKAILYNSIKKSLYPDTYYKWAAGGTPEAITGLTYEDVLKLHEKAYHPSNSLTVLYGNQDLEKSLGVINNYFEKFNKKDQDFELGYQKPYTKMEKYYSSYPVATDNTTARSIMSLNYVIPDSHNYEDTMIDFILMDLLMLGNTNSVKQVVSESGLTSSLNISTNSVQVNQGAISFYSMDIDSRYEDVFVQVIESAIKKAKKEGFDKKDIEAVFNAYKYGEFSSNIGANIGYKVGISAVSGWMYQNDPTLLLNNKEILNKIKARLDSDVFQKAIDELFLNNSFKSLVVINPDKNYESKQAKVLDDKLYKIWNNLTDEGKVNVAEQTDAFYKWQNTPDTINALATVPKLTLTDISNDQTSIEYSKPVDIEGAKIIQTYLDTDEVSNIMLSFDASTIPQEKLQYLQLMTLLLGNTSTKNYGIDELIQLELNYFGSFNAALESVSHGDNYSPRFNITIKTLNEKNAVLLTREILNNAVFDDKELVKKNLEKLKLEYESSLSELTVPLADYLAQAMTSEQGKLQDYIEGYEFYKFISGLLVRIDCDWDKTLSTIEEVQKLVLNKNNLVIGYTNTKDKQEAFIENIKPLIFSLSAHKNKKQALKFRDYGNTIAIITENSTLSVNQVGNIKDIGYQYNGNMPVLASIISKMYLWPNIREQGGAYHTGINIYKNGSIRMTSYADPNFINTIKVYRNVPLFIESISDKDQKTLEGFIIATASGIDNSLQEYNLWNYGINNYISGYSLDTIYKQKQQILDTKIQDIKQYSAMFQKLNLKSKYIVIGNKEIIMKNATVFDEIIKLK